MSLETGNFISDLVSANPLGTDAKSAGDDHLRLIKKVLKNTFPGLVSSSGTDTITLTQSPALSALKTGLQVVFQAGGANTGAATININALGAIAVEIRGAALVGGEIATDDIVVGVLLDLSGTFTLQLISAAATNSAQLRAQITDETGSGLLVFATAPIFTTNITVPIIIGGVGVGTDLIFQTTSGVGDGTDLMIWRGGNNGADEWMRLVTGVLYIGDTATNDVTTGLVLNQGANDDAIQVLKSSDVAHGMTTEVETTTFARFLKADAAAGGLKIVGYRDADGTPDSALVLEGALGEAADTTDLTNSEGVTMFVASIKDGTTLGGVAAGGNAFAFRSRTTTLFILKGDGGVHATNVTGGQLDATALDGEADIDLVRVHQRTIYDDMGIAMSKWDENMKANEDDLKRLGVLSSEGDFTCLQRMDSLIGGAVWQLNIRDHVICEVLEDIHPGFISELNAKLEAAHQRPVRLLN